MDGVQAGKAAERRYFMVLLAMPAMDLVLSLLFVVLAGIPHAILYRIPEVALILVALNLYGGRRLFRPVAAFLDGEGPADAAVRRLADLPRLTGAWAFAVAVLFAVSAFLVTPFVVYGLPAETTIVVILLARAVAWSVILPYTAYFLVLEQSRRMRRRFLAQHGLAVPAGRHRLGGKLVLLAAGGVLVPLASVALNLLMLPAVSPLTGQPRELIMLVTLAGSTIAFVVALVAIQGSLQGTLASLTDGMARVEGGDYTTRIPVETDDELGALAGGFNRLAATLQASSAEAARQQAERTAADRRFHEAQKRDALGRLAGGIAHDFNNLLAIIVGYTSVVRGRLPEADDDRERLQEVLAAAERGKALIAQILAFTRAERPAVEAFDLGAAVAETVGWLAATVTRVRLDWASPVQPLPVLGQPAGIHQVVANLCINAAHASPGGEATVAVRADRVDVDGGRASSIRPLVEGSGPPILMQADETEGGAKTWVGLLRPGAHARLSVTDRGTGMDAGTVRHIFDPYFTTKPVGEGTGLGLAAVLGVVLAHDGAIVVESRPGAGSRFEVYLPLDPARLAGAGTEDEEERAWPTS